MSSPATPVAGPAAWTSLTGRHLDQVAFPLGGIGTGCVSLGGWGQLRDWEIFNRPNKGYAIPHAFFTLRCDHAGGTVARVLQGPVGGALDRGGHGLGHVGGEGLPHFREVSFTGTYPVATVALRDEAVPLTVELEAFNPFIPLNDRDSSLPVAVLIYRLHNPCDRLVQATVFGNLANVIGDPAKLQRVNRPEQSEGLKGLWLGTHPGAGEDPALGTMALATPLAEVEVLNRWPFARAHMWLDHFWQAVAGASSFPSCVPCAVGQASDTGTVAARVEVAPGQTVEVPFLLAWHFPVFRWGDQPWSAETPEQNPPTWLNWYATQWADAWDAAAYTVANLERLRDETIRFRDTLFSSTLPEPVLDAVSSQISILKSPTCLRLTDGTFWAWEGCSDHAGCCSGSCTHVWNYAQALPYLFPALQRSMREADWRYAMEDDGYVTFRLPLPLGTRGQPDFHPAADGQMGTVMQAYREWLISGDTDWLRDIWPLAKRALEFAWRYWDADRDGVMEGMQHNTYDIEFYGPNTMMGSLYLGALRAGEAMARAVGDSAADEYRRLFEQGSRWTDEHLFNGEYYQQQVEPDAWKAWPEAQQKRSWHQHGTDTRFTDWPKWQVGAGCLADQLIGQWYAEMLGLGKLYDPEHIRTALRSLVRHNYQPTLGDHACTFRIYAVGDEAGLLICTWPRGERPGDAFFYGDEVWCGIEYQVAAHLIYEGLVDEGLALVEAVRRRYDGERRNPWDEVECGHHYARSLASYSLLLALSGFRYHAAEARLELAPRVSPAAFRAFFSVGSGWGTVSQVWEDGALVAAVDVQQGSLRVAAWHLPAAQAATRAAATLAGRPVEARVEAGESGATVVFEPALEATPGAPLVVRLA